MNTENRKINILGTEYEILFDLESIDTDGEARFYDKKIHVRPVENMLDNTSAYDEKLERAKEVIRHEIWHCALFEMGADEYADNENLVSLLAINSPKIFKMFQEINVM